MLTLDNYEQLKEYAKHNTSTMRVKVGNEQFLVDNDKIYYLVSETSNLHPFNGFEVVSMVHMDDVRSITKDPRVEDLDLSEIAENLSESNYNWWTNLEIIVEDMLSELPSIEDEE